MAVFQEKIQIKTKKLYDFVKITGDIENIAARSKIKNGMVFANALHNTAALIIQEDDRAIHNDLAKSLERLFPSDEKYEHDYEGNVNATAHLKSNFLGTSVAVPLKDNQLVLGTWQDVFFVELFEQRKREVLVTIIDD